MINKETKFEQEFKKIKEKITPENQYTYTLNVEEKALIIFYLGIIELAQKLAKFNNQKPENIINDCLENANQLLTEVPDNARAEIFTMCHQVIRAFAELSTNHD